MATFNLPDTRNYVFDSFPSAAKAGNDTWNLNGATLYIDGDTRLAPKNTSTTLGAIGSSTISTSLGGGFYVDGSKVWMIPYTGGTGTLPAMIDAFTNATMTAGSNQITVTSTTGLLVGEAVVAYDTTNFSLLDPGVTITQIVSGTVIQVSGTAKYSSTTASVTVTRIVKGATSGAYGEILGFYTISTAGVPTQTPLAAAANLATTPQGYIKVKSVNGTFQAGENIQIRGVTVCVCNSIPLNNYWIPAAGQRAWLELMVVEGTTHTVPRLGKFEFNGSTIFIGRTNGAVGQQITAPYAMDFPAIWVETAENSGTYEIYLNAGTTKNVASVLGGDSRLKTFTCTTAGLITIPNATAGIGYQPDANLRIYVPNIFVSECTAAAIGTVALPAAFGTRAKLTTTSAGKVIMLVYQLKRHWPQLLTWQRRHKDTLK